MIRHTTGSSSEWMIDFPKEVLLKIVEYHYFIIHTFFFMILQMVDLENKVTELKTQIEEVSNKKTLFILLLLFDMVSFLRRYFEKTFISLIFQRSHRPLTSLDFHSTLPFNFIDPLWKFTFSLGISIYILDKVLWIFYWKVHLERSWQPCLSCLFIISIFFFLVHQERKKTRRVLELKKTADNKVEIHEQRYVVYRVKNLKVRYKKFLSTTQKKVSWDPLFDTI